MNSLTVSGPSGVVSVGIVRRMEAHRLPVNLARNLPPSVAKALTLRKASPDYETQPPGLDCVVVAIGEGPTPEDLSSALQATREAMKPGNPADCLIATARLRAVARQQPAITSDEKLSLAVYAEKLAKYPADAVAIACEAWLERSPFWPAISELLRACEWAMQARRALALELLRKLPEQPYVHRDPV